MTAPGHLPVDGGSVARINLDVIYREYAEKCHAFAYRIVRDHHLAHDVVQDVFEALVRQPERFDADRGSLAGWLLTLTHHKAVDLVRWRQRHTRLDLGDDTLSNLLDPDPTPEEATWRGLERAEVVAALNRLKDGDREVLMLAHYGGLSQSEISRRTGLPLGTIKGRTRSAMRQMRVLLAIV